MKLPRRLLATVLSAVALGAAQAAPFEFIAIGDMPYGAREQAYPAYAQLIKQINAVQPSFTIHVGDFKSGGSPCSDEEFGNQLNFFNSFAGALVYTPGDNEWTDCHRPKAGGYDPLERLAKLREMFFATPRTLGAKPLAVERQSELQPAYALYRENLRFEREGVLFVTLHVIGSNNNFEARDIKAVQEFFARDEANRAWVRAAFDRARAINARAVVLAMQADPLESRSAWTDWPTHSGFSSLFEGTLLPAAQAWGKPVLLVHGDSHRFTIDRPFKAVDGPDKGQVLRNLLRLQVFGEQEIHAVRVSVDPEADDPFGFKPLFNPLSPR
ncbi:hypothetical protein RQP53_22290 [Paucibacter sp. APW11]|uniref:Calcineurin-like phosphoesterase domain-containing protein n=1 Tax=Roseateles aquae TaxID=3077235 RepID=A0ABU3PHU7_9BURK|nr:metallophosphoesterase [Paucibacter sp. APW11]MDT9002024.1 hypothetical protein [Paucibacter sp. APW11]